MATGKEQSIKITASSGISEDEIKRMVDDASKHSDEDKKKKERVTLKNSLDNMVYGTEKLLKENGDKLAAATKSEIESTLAEAKSALQAEDADKMKAAQDKLTAASHKLAEEMYKASQGAPEASGQPGGESHAGGEKKDDEPIDAEFTEEK